jgi:hypothetical protein
MTLFKHILVVVALLAAAMPCCHAVGHALPACDVGAEAGIAASHTCACHSCDEAVCHDDVDMPQELTTSSAAFEVPVTSLQLFIISETKPLKRLAPPTVSGILASLQTVQLLI